MKESQCEVKIRSDSEDTCSDTYELGGNNETEYSQSDGGVLYVFGDHNILRKVLKCDPGTDHVSWAFELVEEMDEDDKNDGYRTLGKG